MEKLQRPLLAILGGLVVYTGVDNAVGGISTLGWQLPPRFFQVTNAADFAVRDSHVRFIGGVWLGCGLVLVVSSVLAVMPRTLVAAICAIVFLGGMARFTQGDLVLLAGPRLLPSIVFELVVFPAVGLWVFGTRKGPRHGPLATHASAARPEGPHDLGADDPAGK